MRFVSLTALAVVFAAAPAWADPSCGDCFSVFAMEGRGAVATSNALPAGTSYGGDLHLLLEPTVLALLVGGRYMTDGNSALTTFDFGARWFPRPQDEGGMYLGLGGFVGDDQIADLTVAKVGGVWAELGLELPRTSTFRLTGSVRLDAGGTSQTPESRVVPPGAFGMVSLNVGFLLGGKNTVAGPSPFVK